MINLDISSLEKAIKQLELFLMYVEEEQEDSVRTTINRTATIQAFEYTYELSHKMLRRFLEMTEPNAQEVEELSFQGLIRLASERGLVQGDVEDWDAYRKKRNETSHTYDEETAEDVFSIIPDFLQEARFLCNTLKEEIKHG